MHVLWIIFYFTVGLPVLLGQNYNHMSKVCPIIEVSEISTVLFDHVTPAVAQGSHLLICYGGSPVSCYIATF